MMWPTFSVITGALAAAVVPTGTFTAGVPTGKDAGSFFLAMGHKLVVGSDTYFYPVDFDMSISGSTITITNKTSAITWPQSATFRLQLNELGERAQLDVPMQSPNAQVGTVAGSSYNINVRSKLVPSATECYANLITLGAPVALDDDGICAAQSLAALGTLSINGALASSGSVTLDVPRAVQVVSSNTDTAVITVKGTDVYGQTMSEALTLNGTTAVIGKKAFKTVTLVTAGAAIANLAKVGTTDILGLPEFLPAVGFIVSELQSGNKIGGAESYQMPYFLGQTDLLAGTTQELVSPVSGFITGLKAIVSTGQTVATGGNITVNVGTTAVVGLAIAVPDGSAPGTVFSDVPTTAFSSTTAVAVGSRVVIVPDASFATSGAINGYLSVTGTTGTAVAGIRTAGGSTTTTGDTRGTYKPPIACDGATVWQLLVAQPFRGAGISQNIAS